MGRLSEKVALITGAGSMNQGLGNGKATAIRFAREGAAICILDRSEEAARDTCDLIEKEGGHCLAVVADVTDESEIQRAVDACLSHFGQIDILQNNVGILKAGGALETSVDDWDRIVEVNMKAVFIPTKHILPHFIERQQGVITNISSIAGFRYLGAPYIAYNASKGSIVSFTRNLAIEQAGNGIRANCILPGFIDTPMARDAAVQKSGKTYDEIDWEAMDQVRAANIPLGRVGSPWDVANAAVFLASDEASYITATEIVVDGGVSSQV